ncbi:MAG TPA: vWA domain-containing protein [Mycobacteriales bacterium]|jgi:uncharacterized protein (DUF58 family)
MAGWIRRQFTDLGVTQAPPGPYLPVLQARHGGTVILCLDVSGSMDGPPLREAVRGARTFVAEAVEARYEVGVMLWNTAVTRRSAPSRDAAPALDALDHASAGGGNNLLVPLLECEGILAGRRGDRVVALFGDGDLTPKDAVLRKVAQMKADNVRFVTRGLGPYAAGEFALVSSEDGGEVEVRSVTELADGIAGMARSLRSLGPRR